MQFKKYTKAQMPFLLLAIAFVLTSCGSTQYVSEDNDGIYGSTQEPVEHKDVANDENSVYYKNYFQENATEYDYITEEDAVFTDIDSYEGNYVEQETTEPQSYAGWGQDNNDVTINVYSNFGGYGYNNFWNRPYGYGYSPYWNSGWGYSGFYDPFWGSPYYSGFYGYGYGGYYHSPYWNNYGYNNYHGRNSVSYHNSRRGSSIINGRNSAIY
ncbi:MAG: hypothetical protein KBT69_15625, partial [Oceanihabitans sp.]|nr:hypothetical protein [Oceanihabitans sp.]